MYDGRGGQERTASPIRSSGCQSAAFNTLSCNVCDAAAEVGHLRSVPVAGRDPRAASQTKNRDGLPVDVNELVPLLTPLGSQLFSKAH